jgi:hypothetical protein
VKDLPPFACREDPEKALQTVTMDWWKKEDRLTAAVEKHMFHRVLAQRKRAVWYGRLGILGVVQGQTGSWKRDLNAVETEIFDCPRARKFRQQCTKGRLRVGKGTGRASGDATQEANALFWFSVRQALAGPREDFDAVRDPDGREMVEALINQFERDVVAMTVSTPREVFSSLRAAGIVEPVVGVAGRQSYFDHPQRIYV